MKHKKLLVILSLITSTLTFENSFASILFSDDFQGDLTQWNDTHSIGAIVTDPRVSGSHALAFTNTEYSISSTKTFIPTTNEIFTLSYDYLGLRIDEKIGGGYVGIKNTGGTTTWLSGDGSITTSNHNPDNSQWNHVSFTFTTSLSAFQLKLEQWGEKSDKSGTALFKNLVLSDDGPTPVPVTGTVWLMMTGLFGVLGLNRRKATIQA
ncbi:MAG: hypothetical protein NTX38_08145 [Methylobacter sp.]|nr:hypothetical protein [Methylobacter sp.]